jgi:Phage tail lysozyme
VADNRAVAMQFLLGKGLTRAQAAGVVGSLMQESGLNPNAKNPSSGAFGVGQWLGGRKTALLARRDSGTLRGQLEHLWGELQGPESAALDRLRGAHSVADAASAFTWGFERPGQAEANMPNRIAQARAALGLAGDAAASGAASGGGGTTTTTTTTTPGVDNRQARAQAVLNFLQNKSADPLDFALEMRGLADVPATSHTRTTRARPGSAHQSMLYGGGSTKGSEVLELIYSDGGKGYGIKNGAIVNGPQVYSDVWGGHADHVHVAAGPKTVVALGKLAQQMGLNVGENPHFGGVDPVHVPGSYHYKGEAIDASGTPAQMNAFARAVERYNRTRTLSP